MKKIYSAFLVLLCVVGSLFSQGAFFKPLGSDYQSVKDFLQKQDIALASYEEKGAIRAWTDNYAIEYSFRDGLLYKVEMVRDYENRKTFREGAATIRSNYDNSEAFVMDLSTEKDASSFVVRKKNELHEVYQVNVGKNGFQLRQTILDLDACSQEEVVSLKRSSGIGALLKTAP